jgi:uncharacterized phage protein gp47/JayE
MPWNTPTLRDVRTLVRDSVNSSLPGADANVPNSVLRVMSDNQGALCHLTLQYIDWLALQLLPDTAETEWLDRHGQIWLVNADGSTGRKLATLAQGTAIFQGLADGVVIPTGTLCQSGVPMPATVTDSPYSAVTFETLQDITVYSTTTVIGPIRALDPGSFGNIPDLSTISIAPSIPNVSSVVTVQHLYGGTDQETDDELRARVLARIRQPPMGGDASDYENWALRVPGVTRAWAAPQEFGIGTVTIRFMMDDLRADNDGFPLPEDVAAVQAYIDTVRPVTVKDCYVEAPLKYPIDVHLQQLSVYTSETQAQVVAQLEDMLFNLAAPGQTIYAAWKSYAVMNAPNVISFDLVNDQDDVMPDPGHMAVLGTVYIEPAPPPPPS